MAEITEGVLIKLFSDLQAEEQKCKPPAASPTPDKAKINGGIGGSGKTCTGEDLYKNMEKNADDHGFLAGPKPFVKKAGEKSWTLAGCERTRFPLQAHHLIPKNYLPKHPVCAFLAVKGTKVGNPGFELLSDTAYDNDHQHNGYCLPYASPLKEWKDAGSDIDAKDQLAFDLMDLTKRQLHQGSHREYAYDAEPDAAEEDDDDDWDSSRDGYLRMVGQLLDTVAKRAKEHVERKVCDVCKPDAKLKVKPRAKLVVHMDQVSGILKRLMDTHRIFVSERAFEHLQGSPKKLTVPGWLR